MTDEEKAEKYINKKLCFLCREEKSKSKCATCSTYLTAYICYLDGLKEGRKEQEKRSYENEQLEKNKTCSSCGSFNIDFDEYPCKDCFKDGVLTNWH